jgi:hypothetical protein
MNTENGYRVTLCFLFLQGDSGGPLATERDDKKFELIGKYQKATALGTWLRLALSKGPNRVGVFTTSPLFENGNRSSFRNVAFSSF